MLFLDRNRKLIRRVLLILASALAVIGYFVLPDPLVMQFTSAGEAGTTMGKPIGLVLSFALTAVFAVLYGSSEQRNDQWKYFTLSCIGLLAFAFIYIINLIVL